MSTTIEEIFSLSEQKLDLKIEQYKNKNIIKYTFGPFTSKKQIEIALKIIRKIFPFHSNNQKTEKGCLDYQIGLCSGPYDNAISREEYKKNIRGIKMILEGKMKKLIASLEKEMNKAAKKNEFEKAAELRNKIFALKHIRDVALITKDFEEKLRTTNYEPRTIRIEAYDISNISGTNAVGSMIVFKNNEPDKSQYRKFKIRIENTPNDIAMLKETLERRFAHPEWKYPEVILIDGGIAQLNIAINVKNQKLETKNIKVISIAKRNKDLYIEGKNKFISLKSLPQEIYNLVLQLDDEAHRFAIAYHKKLRSEHLLN